MKCQGKSVEGLWGKVLLLLRDIHKKRRYFCPPALHSRVMMSGISVVVLKSERLPLRKKLIESQGSGARSRKSPTFGGINATKMQRNWGWGEMRSLFLSWDIHLFPSSDTGGPSSQDFSFRLTPLPPPWFAGLLAQTDSSHRLSWFSSFQKADWDFSAP